MLVVDINFAHKTCFEAVARALILIRLEPYPVRKPKENDFIRFVIWSAGTAIGGNNIISKLSGRVASF